MDGLVRGLAIELSPMRGNVVLPGIVNTPITLVCQKTNVKACSMESRSNSLLNALHNLKTLRNLTFIYKKTYSQLDLLSISMVALD